MYSIRRGDIYYVIKSGHQTGSEQQAGRPAVIVSNNENNRYCETVEIVYCTTKAKTVIPTHIEIESTPQRSTVLCEQVTTVSTDRLGSYIGMCSDEEMELIDKAVLISLGLVMPEEKHESPPEITVEQNASGGGTENPPLEKSRDYLSVVAERDTYKNLYDDLISRLFSRKENR